jgi:hypothetical protein
MAWGRECHTFRPLFRQLGIADCSYLLKEMTNWLQYFQLFDNIVSNKPVSAGFYMSNVLNNITQSNAFVTACGT